MKVEQSHGFEIDINTAGFFSEDKTFTMTQDRDGGKSFIFLNNNEAKKLADYIYSILNTRE